MLASKLAEPITVSIGVGQNNGEPDSVVYEFLEELARNSGMQVEEFGAEVMLGENEAL